VANPDRIFPGQQLVLPSLAAVEHEPGTDVHLVVPGDSLWRIAAEAYGDPLLWPRIHAANEDAIIDPNLLHPGQVLRIPQ
jgi:nucleoid-associated protein YgaU